MTAGLSEATVEDAALAYLENIGWTIAHSPAIVPALLFKLVLEEVRWWSLWEEKGCIITHRRYENDKLGEVLRSRTRP